MVTLRPVLDIDFTVVSFREDERNPGGGEEAVGDPLVEVMRAKIAVEEFGQAELLDHAEEERDVINTFVLPRQKGVCHEAYGRKARSRGHKNLIISSV